MADTSYLEKMGSELKCPICLSLLKDAVSLTCNHVFCNLCIVKSMKSGSDCPVCKVPYWRREVRAAPHMDNLVSIYKSMEDASGINIFVTRNVPPTNLSGAGFEAATGRMIMEEGWWDNAIQMNPNYKKFRDEELKNVDLMYNVFGDGSATRAHQFTPTANGHRYRNSLSQVDETASPPHGQNIRRSQNEVNSHRRISTEESGSSRLSGGKRKSSEDTFREILDAVRREFYSAPMHIQHVLKYAEDIEWPMQKAVDILYDMQELEDLDDELFDVGLNELQNVGFRKVWLCVRKHSDRVRMLKKKRG